MRAGGGAVLVLLALVCGLPRRVEAQCSMCRTAVESSQEGRALAVKLNRGILLLLGAPLGVAAATGAAVMRSRRRAVFRPSP